MKESFGGAFMLKIIIFFIIIFVTFMAMAIKYANAYREKNQIINIIEQYQFTDSDDTTLDRINGIVTPVDSQSIDKAKSMCLAQVSGSSVYKSDKAEAIFLNNGACVLEIVDSEGNKIYRVTTYIDLAFPFFGMSIVIPVSGESKTIRY